MFERYGLDAGDHPLLDHLHGIFHEVADHRFDIAPYVADLGEFRRFHFHERRVDEVGKTPGDFRLADAGRANHQNVFRRDLLRQIFGQLAAPEAVPQGDGHGAFCLFLPDDITVEILHDSRRHQIFHLFRQKHHRTSTVRILSV